MTSNYIRYDQDQHHLLSKDLPEWVAEDSLERFVSDTIDYLDEQDRLEPFFPEETDENRGRPQYHPVMLLKVLVFGYAQGIRSSRKLDRLLERDVAFRYLAANQQPDFRTISTFRKDHRQDFRHLFVEIFRLCYQAGMAQLGEVALGGRRVQGDAALDQNRTRAQIEAEIQEILNETAAIEEKEDEAYGPENRGDELPEYLQDKESRLKRLREAKTKLDQEEQALKDEQREKIRQREQQEAESGELKRGPEPTLPEDVELDDTKANTTDPESQTLKSSDGWKQGYNGRAMVYCDSQVIVAQAVTTDANDTQQLEPMLDECEEVTDGLPSKLLADAGYWSKANAQLQAE